MTIHDHPMTTTRRRARPAVRLGCASALLLAVAGCAASPAPMNPGEPPGQAPSTPGSAAPVAEDATAARAARTVRISYAGGTVGGDTGTVAVGRGEPVQIVITSDVAERAHLHGYDREAELPAGRPATIVFTADIPGEFELELHGSGAQLATLQVS